MLLLSAQGRPRRSDLVSITIVPFEFIAVCIGGDIGSRHCDPAWPGMLFKQEKISPLHCRAEYHSTHAPAEWMRTLWSRHSRQCRPRLCGHRGLEGFARLFTIVIISLVSIGQSVTTLRVADLRRRLLTTAYSEDDAFLLLQYTDGSLDQLDFSDPTLAIQPFALPSCGQSRLVEVGQMLSARTMLDSCITAMRGDCLDNHGRAPVRHRTQPT